MNKPLDHKLVTATIVEMMPGSLLGAEDTGEKEYHAVLSTFLTFIFALSVKSGQTEDEVMEWLGVDKKVREDLQRIITISKIVMPADHEKLRKALNRDA